ncbi:MAG: hypothetical protein FWD94_00135 [Treponema sp.]|nr:hypothetical protein [Treponema sp.]
MPLFSGNVAGFSALASVAYLVLASLLLAGFRAFFPGEEPPLAIFADSWWRIRLFTEFIALFPVLALSALVLPFGTGRFRAAAPRTGLSADFLKSVLKVSAVTAVCFCAAHALLSFLVLPLVRTEEARMRFDGALYRTARDRAVAHGEAGEWSAAAQFLSLADGIWNGSPELNDLRSDVEVNIDIERMRWGKGPTGGEPRPATDVSTLPGRRHPIGPADALEMGRDAFDRGDFFDANRMAVLGGELAAKGSPEAAEALALAEMSRERIEGLEPGPAELARRERFRMKLSGYRTMTERDWIGAFHIFREFLELEPNDPDARAFLAICEAGLEKTAFFIDRMNVTVGNRSAAALFSLPSVGGSGRAVLRLESLTSAAGAAYGLGLEYMLFDGASSLLLHLRAPYAKFVPSADGKTVRVLMLALDRTDAAGRWEPTVEFAAEGAAPADHALSLDVGYDAFLLLSRMPGDIAVMHIGELYAASGIAGRMGYPERAFVAEILARLGSGLILLPLSMLAVALGWYFRARRFPLYLFVPMLVVLPLVFGGILDAVRAALDLIGVTLSLALGPAQAVAAFLLVILSVFACSLIALAARKD